VRIRPVGIVNSRSESGVDSQVNLSYLRHGKEELNEAVYDPCEGTQRPPEVKALIELGRAHHPWVDVDEGEAGVLRGEPLPRV
jgi:hypothetical protein